MTSSPIAGEREAKARELLAQAYEEHIGEGPYPTYAALARTSKGDFTLCSIRAIQRALAALLEPVGEGWVMVPVEPTDAQILHAWDRASGIAEAGKRRLAFGREVLALVATPAVQPDSPHERDDFRQLCREHDILGTAMEALCGVFWAAGAATPQADGPVAPKAEPKGLADQLSTAVQSIEEGHDPFCMSVLRGKECSCGKGTPQAASAQPVGADTRVVIREDRFSAHRDTRKVPQHHGDCFGITITPRDGHGDLVELFVEDDEFWHFVAAFDVHWVPELIRVLSLASPPRAIPAEQAAPTEPAMYQFRRKNRFNGQLGEWQEIDKKAFFEIQKDIEAGLVDSNFELRRLYAHPHEAADRSAEAAYWQGWCEAADWAKRDDLYADRDSDAYEKAMRRRLAAMGTPAAAEPGKGE